MPDNIADGRIQSSPPTASNLPFKGPRVPLPGPQDEVRPRMGLTPIEQKYMQGEKMPATSSALISNSKYLNNPYYREAYVTQALRRHGHDLPPTYMVPLMMRALEEVTDWRRMAELVEAEKKIFPAFAEWLEARNYTSYTKEDTAQYEPGTLGRAIHDFLSIPGMDIEFAARSRGEVKSDLEYLLKRRSAGHDIEHIVTGFAANTAGENALSILNVTSDAAFFTPELAQLMSATNVWVSSTGYNRIALHYHHVLPVILDALRQGIAAGQALKQPLFMTRWEDYLDWQLEALADHLGFSRGPGAAWDWSTDEASG